MRRPAILVCAAVALVAGSARADASSTARAELRIVRATPLVVAGTRFLPRERVTVRVQVKGERRARAVAATRAGGLLVRFSSLVYDRCATPFRIWAIGSGGSRVDLKAPRTQCPPPPPE